MKKNTIDRILNETESGYDSIADRFSTTRKRRWRDLEILDDYVKSGDRVLDFGCGDGRIFNLFRNKSIEYHGVDVSEGLLRIARGKYKDKNVDFRKISGSESLPFPDSFFNVAVSVAVFHHLPGKETRQTYASELFRVIKPGGCVIVTAWRLWQKKYIGNVFKNLALKLAGKSDLDFFDAEIPFRDNLGNRFYRYHHAFTKSEFKRLFEGAGFTEVEYGTMSRWNIIFIGRKP